MILSSTDILSASILIVDDQAANLRLLQEWLVQTGYTNIRTTMDTMQVCALHRRHDFDLILLDLHVPVVDGFQVTAALLPGDDEDYFPVVVLTSQPVSKRRARQAGWGRDGRQPFDLEQLKARIHSTLEVRLLFRCLEVHNGRTARTARAPEQAARLIGLAASD